VPERKEEFVATTWSAEQWLDWTIDQLIEARRDQDWMLVRDVANVLRAAQREWKQEKENPA
jgi:flagellin-specific chaperone FliS